MTHEETVKKLDQIALDMSLMDMGDLRSLAGIQGSLEQIAAAGEGALAGVASLLARLATDIIIEETADADRALEVMMAGVELLQRLADGEQAPEEVKKLGADIAILIGDEQEMSVAAAADDDAAPESVTDESQTEESSPPVPDDEAQAGPVHDDLFYAFVTEANEHLEAAEHALLELQSNPGDDETLNDLFRSFHTIKGAAGFLNLEAVGKVTHAAENLLDLARKGSLSIEGDRMDAVFATVDKVRALIAFEESEGQSGPPPDCGELTDRLHELASEQGSESPDAAGERQGSDEAPALDGAGVSEVPAVASAGTEAPVPAKEQAAPGTGGGKSVRKAASMLRVDTEKLDDLVNMVGELVIAYSLVTSRVEASENADPELVRDTVQMAKIIKDLQERTMALRMVPIKGVFERMARLVYDLSRKMDKDVELVRHGDETEVDKNVVEEIVDPLVHLVRNSVDHGLESAEERVAAGKPARGTVELSARHQGGNIVIELRDDGKGLSRERIQRKAVERGVIKSGDELTDEQVYELIFQPGFSTAETVTEVSGRGVGLDVVRQNVLKLHGKVEVKSETGKGSTFSISLPLTLAIIDGMVISVGEERYIVPLLSIVESLRPKEEEIFTVEGRGEMVRIRESLFPIVRLHRLFDAVPRTVNPWESLLIMLEGGESGRYCLMVDELVGIQQVVIKGLEEHMRGKGISGCAILGDGRVGLILDVARVFEASLTDGAALPGLPVSNGRAPAELPVDPIRETGTAVVAEPEEVQLA